ncbi:serine hydrolase [Longivirga aurantiaca]|uniref:Serine hydrolase n=1 Tax=Longivirga aurantiaca TaxID=1837743 RepID=A0ABW1SX36_9ACTN
MDDLLTPLDAVADVAWSAVVLDAATGRLLAVRHPDRVLPTASVGKLLLLLETARRLADGRLDPSTPLRRGPADSVADSGLWQHLRTDALPLEDVALLVASVSDNLATNVLLRHVGLDAVAEVGPSLGLGTLRLHDQVRDVRTTDDPPTLSQGCALDLARFAALLATEDSLEWAVLRRWLASGVDLSMVPGDLGLDPLAHVEEDRGIRLLGKTGTDSGVRADVGIVASGELVTAYAVVASWTPSAHDPKRDDVLGAMRAVGRAIAAQG